MKRTSQRHYLPSVKLEVVERFEAGESASALAREYSMPRTRIYA
jgi:transposase-like protein